MPDWIDDTILLCAWYPVPESADYPTVGTAAASDGRSANRPSRRSARRRRESLCPGGPPPVQARNDQNRH
ncbi:MAG TPA: hypothetical protein VFF65_13800 [Phycisphaerales bacterium]|nr:hypothetical protein [Phycisphaerales bacterium]